MLLNTYQETLDYLFHQLPMFSRIGAAAYKKDLTNTIALCNAVNNPQHQFKSIHIAGTNGKGSTSHMLAAVLQQAGYKVGLYTSPHLKDFRERIRINGEMIPEQEVITFTNTIIPISKTIEPSFFEITVAMAYTYFAKEQVDIAVIETGLGGRLDSTNVITPLLSIITNIGFDHQNLLGNTLQEIASEKAGIIKQNVPVIIGEVLPETESIFIAKAKEKNVPIYFAFNEIAIEKIESGIDFLRLTTKAKNSTNTLKIELGLKGLYQQHNVKSVLVALQLLQSHFNFEISTNAILNGLKNVQSLTGLNGRWELIQKKPIVILDVAHNVDGIMQLNKNIEALYKQEPTLQNLHLVIGMVKDKDIDAVLNLLPQNAQYYFTQANIPRALPKEDLQLKAANFQLEGTVYDNVNIALQAAKQNATIADVIIVCGSVFLVGEIESK